MDYFKKQALIHFVILLVLLSCTWLCFLGFPKTPYESKQVTVTDKDSITNKFGVHPYIVYQFADGTFDGQQVSLVQYSNQKIGDKLIIQVPKKETAFELFCMIMGIILVFFDVFYLLFFISVVHDIF